MVNQKWLLGQLKHINKQFVSCNVPLCALTSFKIGGNAKLVVQPSTLEEIVRTITLLNDENVPYYILGNGTNVLASDKGYNGVIVRLNSYSGIECEGNTLQVLGGTSLSQVVTFANTRGLGGMEDGFGIPGSVGGAITMNASAYGYETSNVVSGVLAMLNGKIAYLSHDDMQFVYRNSVLSHYQNPIVLRVDFLLTPNQSVEELTKRSAEIMQMRKTNQPLNFPSAGSVFKRIDGIAVSKLMDEAGLKDTRVGDAQVSEKHAGFIVNLGHATSKDVQTLIAQVKQVMQEKYNLQLQEEIKFLSSE